MRFELRLLHADSEKDLWLKFNKKKQGLTFVFNTKEKAPMSSTQIKFGHGRKNPLDLDSFQGFLACHGILFIN